MKLQVDLIEEGPEGIYSPDIEGIEVEDFMLEEAQARAIDRFRDLAKHEEVNWNNLEARVRIHGEHFAYIEL